MYKAAVTGNWKQAEELIRENSLIKYAIIMRGGYNALHIATGAQQLDFVRMLMAEPTIDIDDLRKTDDKGNNAFCIAASAGSLEIAKLMLSIESTLLTTRGNREMLPLCLAAWFGREEMAKYLYQGERQKRYSPEDLIPVFFASIESGLFGFASTLLENKNHHDFALKCDSDGKTVLHLLAQKPSAFTVGTPAGSTALKLLEAVLRILEKNSIFTSEFRQLIRCPSHVLFDAVKSENSEFVVKLIEICPSLIWETNDRNWTIIHAAVSHRDETIFNLLQEFGFFKDVIGDFRDSKNGDTLLHLAARLAPTSQLDKLPGAAFQMQRELLWFEKVKNTVQAAVTEVRNGLPQTFQEGSAAEVSRLAPPGGDSHHEATSADQQRSASQQGNATESEEDKTPQELFTIQHKLLLKEGRKWMNGTAQSCTVVSTLIAGALFAAGIAVTLGGNKGTSDHNFQKVVYRIFIISDAMAFLFALAAILTFLSILTSRYAERDFLESLPSKLRVGLGLLFCSIITMMVAFCSAFIIAYSVEDLLPYLIIEYTVLMVLLCLYMDRSLLTYILKSRFS
ncbi:uncharacterized protein LOC133713498 [Rosa rugosa]|uniref:uncharacterized protein LOC133713498 n=1 Tax=Rosa rugosa TaxID=74645 RepID=UPI002B40A8DD|nr:uncharacterized protein LOC133713498 [Rosa rugosa]